MRLTSETIESVVEAVASGEQTLDLRDARSIDIYALLLLDLLVRDAREAGHPLRIIWPEAPSVRRWMTAMRFFVDVKTGLASRRAGEPGTLNDGLRDPRGRGAAASDSTPGTRHAGALVPIASIDHEDDVSRLVGVFADHLSDRFPIDESPRRRFLRILLELFQNIPQHANAAGDVFDPHGIAAMQDDERGLLLAVADKGIGLARSLGLSATAGSHSTLASGRLPGPRADADALRAIVFDGRSRFHDPGRGHELERIFRLVRSWEGTMIVRTGSALLFQSDLGGDVIDVAPFPGVQIALFIPRAAFGIGEPAGEAGVELRDDPRFNGGNEDDDG